MCCWPVHSGVRIDLVSVELRTDGTLSGRVKHYSPYQILQPTQQPKFLRPSDRTIVRRLAARWATRPTPARISSRRCVACWRPGAAAGVRPTASPFARARRSAAISPGARRRTAVSVLTCNWPAGLQLLVLSSPWYADPKGGSLGPVELDLPPRLVRTLLAAPAVPPEMAGHVAAELGRRLPGMLVPSPQRLAPACILAGRPAPQLVLFAADLPFDPMDRLRPRRSRRTEPGGAVRAPLARMFFRYGPVTLAAFRAAAATTLIDGQLYRVVRDHGAEAAFGERLRQFNLGRLGSLLPSSPDQDLQDALVLLDDDPAAWIDFVLHEVPALRAEGWAVDIEADFPLRFASCSGELTATIHHGSGIDWFDLELGVMVDGTRVDLLPALLEMIAHSDFEAGGLPGSLTDDDAPILVPLPDGRLLPLPADKWHPFLATILELFAGGRVDPATGRVRLARSSAADLALAEAAGADAGVTWTGGGALRALGQQLRQTTGIPSARLADSFAGRLRPYQARGVDWLQFLLGGRAGRCPGGRDGARQDRPGAGPSCRRAG